MLPSQCPNPGCASVSVAAVLERTDDLVVNGEASRVSYSFLRCVSCGLAFVWPVPEPEVLSAYYASGYAYHGQLAVSGSQLWRVKYALAAMRYRALLGRGFWWAPVAALGRAVETLSRRTISFSLGIPLCLPKNARMLDVGCGRGEWLLRMKELGYSRLAGCDVEGNRPALVTLRKRGIDVFGLGDTPAEAAASFDLIRLEHVFEHLPDPLSTLAWIGRLLRRAGLLVMTFPSVHPWEPIEQLPRRAGLEYLQLPFHLMHHSRRSAEDFLTYSGFELMAIREVARFRYITLMARQTGNRSEMVEALGGRAG